MTTAPKPFAFVLMPFSKKFDDTYELAIQPACEQAGAYAERVDKQIFTGSILERVFNQISKADLIIADMSERNPNVFYEVGYAHALGKTTILLTNQTDDIPFDFKHYPHIVYNNRLIDLKCELQTRVRWHIDNPNKSETNILQVRVNNVIVSGHSPVKIIVGKGCSNQIVVEVHNKISRSITTANFQIGLFVPIGFICHFMTAKSTMIEVDAVSRLYLSSTEYTLRPEMWEKIPIHFVADNEVIISDKTYECIVRIYLNSGVHDYPFTVHTISTPE